MPSSVREVLEGFVAGRVPADQVVIAVATAYYGDGVGRPRDALRPLIEVIERGAPGIVELTSVAAGPGFEIRLAERSLPEPEAVELRQAARACLASGAELPRATPRAASPSERASQASGVPRPGVVARLVAAVRRLFTVSG
ncbi:MAG TPA: hypothetical protein VM736_06985 [Gemmatimonadales bacterium]|nr:hypothetical protein [Gemmatimonadales bacterium]